jgi:Mg-chelatase subunit ChlD
MGSRSFTIAGLLGMAMITLPSASKAQDAEQDFDSSRQPPDWVHVKHIESGWMTYTLRYTLRNYSLQPRGMERFVELSNEAVVVDVRAGNDIASFDTSLLTMAAATEKYEALQQRGHNDATGAVLVSNDFGQGLRITAYQVAGESSTWVEFDVLVATERRKGLWYAPIAETPLAPMFVDRRYEIVMQGMSVPDAVDASAAIVLRGQAPLTSVRSRAPSQAPLANVRSRAPSQAPLQTPFQAAYGRVPLPDGNGVSMLQFDVADSLLAFEPGTAVVFVVDRSASMSANQLQQQLAAIAEYTRISSVGAYQIIAFDRHAEALLPGFVSAAELREKLPALRSRLQRHNGSNLDQALQLATSLLPNRASRLLVFTDGALKPSINNDALIALAAALPSNTIVHAIAVNSIDVPAANLAVAWAFIEDESVFTSLAKRSGGMAGYFTSSEGNKRNLDALVAPTAIDEITVQREIATEEPAEQDVFGSVEAGSSVRRMWPIAGRQALTLRGRIWSKPWSVTVSADPTLRNIVAAFAANNAELDEPIKNQMAMIGHALNPSTAFLLTPRNVQPTTIEASGATGGGSSTCCSDGTLGTIGRGRSSSIDVARLQFPTDAVRDLIVPCAGDVHGDAEMIPFVVVVQGHEILDVVNLESEAPLTSARNTCVMEAIWKLMLPTSFVGRPFRMEVSFVDAGVVVKQFLVR